MPGKGTTAKAACIFCIRSGGEISNKTPVTAMGLWFFKVITLQPRRGFAGSEGAPSAFQERLGATGSVRSLVKR